MGTEPSIGGIVGRGVPEGLALVDHAVRERKNWFVRSDIRDFFTRIPQYEVNKFIRDAVCNVQFSNFFEKSLATQLTNQEELEERNVFKLFPNPEIGVAQGSALSALAGNISLHDFDEQMNGRGIVCIRYIDDFILLGPSEAKVLAAYQSARRMLRERGMDIYDLDNSNAYSAGKVDQGNIHNGTDFLGYTISARSRQPCKAARTRFLEKLDAVVKTARREMKAAFECSSTSHRHCFHRV